MTETTPPRVIAVVLNQSAGALVEDPAAMRTLVDQFAGAGLTPEFIAMDAGTLPERVEHAKQMNPAAIVVAGGDGTVACAAQALAGTGTPLGILPFGTMNLLAKDLGIPAGAPEAALRIIAAGATRAIDVAEVNGHLFLCASMLGLPVRVGRYREAQRGRASGLRLRTRLAFGFMRLLSRHLPPRMDLNVEGTVKAVRAPSITITANAVDEPDGRSFGRSRLDGGELVVYVIERLKLADMARLVVGWLRGDWRHTPVVSELRGPAITLHTRRRAVRVMNDGEIMLLQAPLTYSIRRGALRVFAPPPSTSS